MNLLHIGSRPEPKQAHNCRTWFPNGNPFEKIEWVDGVWRLKETAKAKEKREHCAVSKYAGIAQDVAKHFAGREFRRRDICEFLDAPHVVVDQVVQYLARYEMIEKVGFIQEGRRRMSIYRTKK